MANATYILGTNEYLVVELTRTALSATFTAANWEYELCLVGIGEDFDEAAATWVDAVYELATDSGGQTHHTVKALIGGDDPPAEEPGKFTPYVRMTSVTESETPTILRAWGRVTLVGTPTPAA